MYPSRQLSTALPRKAEVLVRYSVPLASGSSLNIQTGSLSPRFLLAQFSAVCEVQGFNTSAALLELPNHES